MPTSSSVRERLHPVPPMIASGRTSKSRSATGRVRSNTALA